MDVYLSIYRLWPMSPIPRGVAHSQQMLFHSHTHTTIHTNLVPRGFRVLTVPVPHAGHIQHSYREPSTVRPDSENWFTPTASSTVPHSHFPHLRRPKCKATPCSCITIYPSTIAFHSRLSFPLSLPCSTDRPGTPTALSTPSIQPLLGLPLTLTPLTSAFHTLFVRRS